MGQRKEGDPGGERGKFQEDEGRYEKEAKNQKTLLEEYIESGDTLAYIFQSSTVS